MERGGRSGGDFDGAGACLDLPPDSMDSLTQAALGATVGAAVAGHTLGRRAVVWGAIAGTVPDLDVVAYPFLDESGALRFHRGLTHGLAFCLWAGPTLGWLAHRFDRWRDARARPTAAPVGLRAYVAVLVLALVTHPLLDVFTVYGTQLLAPFSDRPFAVGSTFIIDPAYTVPLAVGLAGAIWAKRRREWAIGGLVVSTAVLGLHVAAQRQARATVEQALADRGVEAERVLVAAGPLTSLLWRGAAEADGTAFPFSLQVFDRPGEVVFEPSVPLVEFPPEVARRRGAATLSWFSRGWLTPAASGPDATGDPGAVADLRFGRAGLGASAPFIFSWDLLGGGRDIRQRPIAPEFDADDFRALGRRALRLNGPQPGPRRTTRPSSPPPP